MELTTYNGLEYLDANPTAEQIALVLHWGGSSGRVGLPFAQLLPDWRIIAPSLRGHGRNPLPTASVDVCGQDVRALLDHLGVTRLDRLYAYSVGGYVATRVFGHLPIARTALFSGGVVPFGIAMPDVYQQSTEEQPETAQWLEEQRASIATPGRTSDDIEREWATMLAVYGDIFDLTQPRLTFRLTSEQMRPAIASIWEDNYFAQPDAPTPDELLFWNGNDPVACKPYIEQFERRPGCREITLDGDPFDVRWSVVQRVIDQLA